MFYFVVNTQTKECVYKVKNDIWNAADERNILNAPYDWFNQPYAIVCGRRKLEALGYKENKENS